MHKCKNMVKKIKIDLLKKVKPPSNIHSIDDCTSYDQVEVFTNNVLKEYLKAWNSRKVYEERIKYFKLNHEALVDNVATILGISKVQTAISISFQASNKAYPELHQHDIPSKLKTWIYYCCRMVAEKRDDKTKAL